MPDNREPIEGSYQDRENRRNEHKSTQGRIRSVRRALMATGLVVAGLFTAATTIQNIQAQNQDETGSPYPAATEIVNTQRAFEELLKRYPDAKVHVGGRALLNFVPGERTIYPAVRLSPNLDTNSSSTNRITDIGNFRAINGIPVNFNERVSLQIRDFAIVEGANPDNRNNPMDKGKWLAVSLTSPDGNTVWGFISRSNQTAEFVTIDEGGNPTSLDLFTGSDEMNNFNKTTVSTNH